MQCDDFFCGVKDNSMEMISIYLKIVMKRGYVACQLQHGSRTLTYAYLDEFVCHLKFSTSAFFSNSERKKKHSKKLINRTHVETS